MTDDCRFKEGQELILPDKTFAKVLRVSPMSVTIRLEETRRVVQISRESEGVFICHDPDSTSS